ncbi:MAG TPA: DUF255 domain-containing protein, partial [Thermoanaerobaculia bacterium]|nr:DUF255 domain-containing protein [Thermoanaerobaculia bacterium]
MGNAFAGAASRYVRDAESSPVAWKPWGPAAIELARKSNRPLFVSVGFASSYDAFAMHRDAFNTAAIAAALNGEFVPVLLDRFEHAEAAEALDTLQQAMGGALANPSMFVLTPALEPFAQGGPMEARELGAFLAAAATRWANERDAATAEARAILVKAHLLGEQRAPGDTDAATLNAAIESVAQAFKPAAPRPMAISFALRHATATDNRAVRAVALDALRTFAKSPVRDQLGGGFFRAAGEYDKLLSDQALFAMTYLEAWQLTREPEFEQVVRTTLDYALRDLNVTKGGFEATQDAYGLVPVDGRPVFLEGAFYLWSKDELVRLFGADTAAKLMRIFGMAQGTDNLPVLAEEAPEELKPAVAKMLEHRQRRPEPFRDSSHLSGWNGLMISALSRAGAALGEPRYTDAAVAAARAVTTKLWNDKKKILHRGDSASGQVAEATADDHAMLVQGLLDV